MAENGTIENGQPEKKIPFVPHPIKNLEVKHTKVRYWDRRFQHTDTPLPVASVALR